MKGQTILLAGLMHLLLNMQVTAQETATRDQQAWLMRVKAVAGTFHVIDKSFSSIPYTGISWGAAAGIKYQKRKGFHELDVLYTKGTLETASQPVYNLQATYVNVDYLNLYNIGPGNSLASWVYKAGGSIDVLYAKRKYSGFINQDMAYEFAASLSGAFEVAYFFKKRLSGLSILNRIQVPLVTSVMQPAFGNEDATGYVNGHDSGVNAFIESNRVVSFDSFLRIKNLLILEKKLSYRQQLSISYTWDYYQIRGSREVKQANHQIGLMYGFIL